MNTEQGIYSKSILLIYQGFEYVLNILLGIYLKSMTEYGWLSVIVCCTMWIIIPICYYRRLLVIILSRIFIKMFITLLLIYNDCFSVYT